MSENIRVELLRLFIAISVPEAVQLEIEKTQGELRRVLPPAWVRWTKREQFHLTLRFLGDVERTRLEDLTATVRRGVQGFPPLRLRAAKVGFFPDARRPRVIWVGVRDEGDGLALLQRAVADAAAPFTSEEPEAKFAGHITLGRIKGWRRAEAEAVARLLPGMADRVLGEWTADRIEVMRSELAPAGARHTLVAEVPLRV